MVGRGLIPGKADPEILRVGFLCILASCGQDLAAAYLHVTLFQLLAGADSGVGQRMRITKASLI